ncbi:MAG: hypothetical protein HYU37_22205 [Acidobacteria bacterium]|nr:hypothetical protein [Acidobacteriota bacterium]
MFRDRPILPVTCVVLCLSLVPWTHAFAEQAQPITAAAQPSVGIRESIRQMSFAAAAPAPGPPSRLRDGVEERGRQSVATTTESKLLLGVATGALMVGGMTMMAYGASATCKGKQGESTSACDRTALIGTMSFSGGAAMALLWALSRD